ncbi:tetratricopeptide repeat protein [Geobacter pelophilus]|uniref:Tetratricopeptide repeat protein n=1 Tax=Geoanaerobacter pelophilus TaxID=60036 RepID=A0AAW4L5M7_9BACT|nr:tetratricopeptide repeat protein [Geoanaerobacter pelophilus]MBT0664857.1 tetratricopeptide repeat protein [Geoanaerobacter pelophilus]
MNGMNSNNALEVLSDRHSSVEPAPLSRSSWLGGALIFALVLLAYSSVFYAGFIWDDDSYLTENPYLSHLSGLVSIWVSPGATPQYYPMVFSVFWLEYHLWGLNPVGYHLVNIIIHIINALLIWTALRHFRVKQAFWAAAIFALHPVHVESVAWITELKNVLSLFFYMLALLSYFRFLKMTVDGYQPLWQLRGYYVAAFFFFVLALLSKTVTATLPAAILLLIWWRDGRIVRKDTARLLPFFVVGVAMGLFTAHLEKTLVSATGAEWNFSTVERILIAGRAVWFYAGKLLWPDPLIFSYPKWHIDAGQWAQYLFPVGVFAVLGVSYRFRGIIGRGPLTSLLFFIGTLFPALGFFNVYPMRYSFVADHFQYAASVGIICLFCASLERIIRRISHETLLLEVGCYCGILLLIGLVTWQQGKTYKNTMALYTDIIEKNPSSWFSYTNRAMEYMDQGKYDLAVIDMERALETHPNKSEALSNRAVLRQRGADYQGALADFSKALELDPARVGVLINRSDLYLLLKRYDLALQDCNNALRIKNDYVDGYLQRARIYELLKDNSKRLGDLSKVLQLTPGNMEALAERGLLHYQLGQFEKAVADFSKALDIDPGSAPIYDKRARALAASGEKDKALADFQHARSLGYVVPEAEITSTLDPKSK